MFATWLIVCAPDPGQAISQAVPRATSAVTGPWTSPQPLPAAVDTAPGETAGNPAAITVDGELYVAYHGLTWRVGPNRLRYAVSTNVYLLKYQGDRWSPAVRLASTAQPSAAIGLAAGTRHALHAVWGERTHETSGRPFGFPTAVAYASTASGAKNWSRPIRLFEGADEMPTPPRIAVDGSDTVHVAYPAYDATERPAVYYQQRRGGQWSVGKPLAVGGYPDLVADPSGHEVFLAYVGIDAAEKVSVNDVFFALSRNEGRSWEPPRVVHHSNPYRAFAPQIVRGGGTTVHLLWAKDLTRDAVPEAVWHSYSRDRGITWSEPGPATLGRSDVLGAFRAVADSCGRLHLLYQQSIDSRRVYYARWEAGAGWSERGQAFSGKAVSADLALAIVNDTLHAIVGFAVPGSARLWHSTRLLGKCGDRGARQQ